MLRTFWGRTTKSTLQNHFSPKSKQRPKHIEPASSFQRMFANATWHRRAYVSWSLAKLCLPPLHLIHPSLHLIHLPLHPSRHSPPPSPPDWLATSKCGSSPRWSHQPLMPLCLLFHRIPHSVFTQLHQLASTVCTSPLLWKCQTEKADPVESLHFVSKCFGWLCSWANIHSMRLKKLVVNGLACSPAQ